MIDFDDLKEVFVDEEYKLESITPNCELFFEQLKREKEGLVSLTSIGEWGTHKGYIFPSIVQWLRMLWKAGRLRRFVDKNEGWIGRDGKRQPYRVHYLICSK